MTGNEIAGFIISGGLGAVIIVFGIVLLAGRGSFLVAGFNTLPKDRQETYDKAALCKFMGKILLPIGVLCPGIGIGGMFDIFWFPAVFVIVVVGLVVFAAIYANTGNRFRR